MAIELKDSYKVLSTTNYSLFKYMQRNRDVDHVGKIEKSIKKVGYVPVPIIVNDAYEIIDGQNRCSACEKLGLPIYYIVIPGLTIDHCISLNIGQSNWKMADYIKSYAVEDVSYRYLQNLIKQFPEFTPRVIAVASGSFGVTGGGHTNSINNGYYHCTENQYEKAIEILAWLKSINEKANKVPGRIEYLKLALIFAYRVVPDISSLTGQINKYLLSRDSAMNGITDMESAIKCIDDVYNYRNRRKFDVVSAYRSAVRRVKDEPKTES